MKTLLTISALAGLSLTTAQAATLVWDDDGPGESWSTTTNWAGDPASGPANGDSVELTQRNVLDYAFTVMSGQSIIDTVGSNWLGLGNDGWTGGAPAGLTLASGGTINVGILSPRGNSATLFPTLTIEDGASLTTVTGLDANRSTYLIWEAGTSSVTTWNTTNFTSSLGLTTVDLTDPLVGTQGALTLVNYSGTGTNHAHDPRKGLTPDKPEDVFTGIKAIVAEVRTRLPKAKLIIFSVFPRGPETTQARVTALNAMLPKLADDKQVLHMDINQTFLGKDGAYNPALYKRDQLHLDAKGYDAWAKALLPILKQHRVLK